MNNLEEKQRSRWRFERIKRWYFRYERYLIPGSLLLGVTTDALLFQNINLNFAFSILTWHLFMAGIAIAFIQSYDALWFSQSRKAWQYLRLFAPLVLQYTFGALLSGFLIFYWFSSAFTASWPFIVLIIFLMISNDLLKKYYLWLNIQIGVYFFILFSYCALILPFLLRNIAVWVFLLSGLVSLILISLYLYALAKIIPTIYERWKLLAGIIVGVFVALNFMYFTNIIPPVPLSLREAGIYYSITRAEGEYRIVTADKYWWQRFYPRSTIKVLPGQRIYMYTAIFTPTRLDTDIVHHWQYYNDNTRNWTTRIKITYPISGGRDGGYRGFSLINNPPAGLWRVDVETKRGQVIGRKTFRVEIVSEQPQLEIIYR